MAGDRGCDCSVLGQPRSAFFLGSQLGQSSTNQMLAHLHEREGYSKAGWDAGRQQSNLNP